MVEYEASDNVLWKIEKEPYIFTCHGRWTNCYRYTFPEHIENSSFKFKFELKCDETTPLWSIFVFLRRNLKTCTPEEVGGYYQPKYYCIRGKPAWRWYEQTFTDVSSGEQVCFNSWERGLGPYPTHQIRKIHICGTPVGIAPTLCLPFQYISDGCGFIGGWFHDVADVFRDIWYVGPPIADVFDSIGSRFDSMESWFWSLYEWCLTIVNVDYLGDAWAWLQELFADPYGTITGVLGDTWTWLVELRNDFMGAVTAALGTTWNNLVDLYNNFSPRVTNALGDTWTWLVGLYNDFTGAVTAALGTTWNNLVDLYNNFSPRVTNALGDTWTWLVGLYNDFTGAVTAALGDTWTWLVEFAADPMEKIGADIEEKIKSLLDWSIQEAFKVIEASWSTFEDSFKWLTTKMITVIGDAAEDFADEIWDMVEKVMKKL